MIITIKSGNDGGTQIADITREIDCDAENPYKKIWQNNLYPISSGASSGNYIEIEFDDADGAGVDYYWAICGITVEESNRVIELKAGS